MKTLKLITLGIIIALFTYCNESGKLIFPKSSFTGAFPKDAKNLTLKLGKEVSILKDNDTLTLTVEYNSKTKLNTLINKETGDTVFHGQVSKYKGTYYFSAAFSDTAYWIWAVKIRFDQITGLDTEFEQMLMVDKLVDMGKYTDLLVWNDTVNDIIRLNPEKKQLRRMFINIIDSFPAYPIIYPENTIKSDSSSNTPAILSDKFKITNDELIEEAFPNPAKSFCTLLLEDTGCIVELFDSAGKLITRQVATDRMLTIDVTQYKPGNYIVRVLSPKTQESESIQLIIK